MHVTLLREMTRTLPAMPSGICTSHIPGGKTFKSRTGGGGGPLDDSSRGPPAEPGRAGRSLNDVRAKVAAREEAVVDTLA